MCPIILDIDVGAVAHVLLRDVEDIAVRIMRRDAGEGPVGGTLLPFDRRIIFAQPVEGGLGIFDLDAEMIETGRTPGAPGIDVEPDIAVAHRHRPRGPRLGRSRHAEHRLVELAQLGVVLADDGDVVELGEHTGLPVDISRTLPETPDSRQ
jgi:hypothetical protein